MRERLRRRGLGARFFQRNTDRPLILLYHRVDRLALDPLALAVTPERFAEQLDLLLDRYRPVSLADLSAEPDGAPPRAVVLTFDDGYVDNLDEAKPLLEKRGIPATVFVASGLLGAARFWWDEVERLVLRSPFLPSTLELRVGDEAVGLQGRDPGAPLSGAWTVLSAEDPSPRCELYRRLLDLLRETGHEERETALAALRASVADGAGALEPSTRPVTPDELGRLADGVVEVGAHTVTHPVLSRLPSERQRFEVEASKSLLEDVLGRRIRSFAYPYGASGDFDSASVAAVRASGFDCACANVPARVRKHADRFRLPRVVVRDWTGEELERRLSAVAP